MPPRWECRPSWVFLLARSWLRLLGRHVLAFVRAVRTLDALAPIRMFGLRFARSHAALQECLVLLVQNAVLLDPLLQCEAVERGHSHGAVEPVRASPPKK